MKQSGICQIVQINRTFLNDILQKQLADLHNMIYKKEGKYCLIHIYKWYFVVKIVLTYCEKKCSSFREKILKLVAQDLEFAKFLRSLEHTPTVSLFLLPYAI